MAKNKDDISKNKKKKKKTKTAERAPKQREQEPNRSNRSPLGFQQQRLLGTCSFPTRRVFVLFFMRIDCISLHATDSTDTDTSLLGGGGGGIF